MDGGFLLWFLQDCEDGEPREEEVERREVQQPVIRPLDARPRLRTRVYRTRVDLEQMSDNKVITDYHLNRMAIYELYEEIRADIDPPTARSHAVPGLEKLLTVLQFLATGTFQHVIGGNSGVDQSTVSRHLTQVLQALKKRVRQYIKFPEEEGEQQGIKQDFFQIAGMPHVLGAIDCTDVLFTPPSDEEMMYRNRKLGFSLNIQAVCDANLRILDVVSKFPGSCLDSYILANSALGQKFADGKFGYGWLLGDAGYGCKPWLMTPLAAPRTEPERRYNESHMLTRCTIERTFRVLKSRFRCLHLTVGSLQYAPHKVADIVTVCCMLHNIALKHQLEINVSMPPELDKYPSPIESDVAEGNAVRQKLIEQSFT
ncbi:putative nuclease HARBI1 [Microcaecilia unicolor]|uniref:Putative nuclease HARBI1 n=1 Tax=Microcaecilia unicolor TaxID=1415580 RepID=A0A6P7XJ00_9AMPH|nr:putative nuclease HARBI1 [Microcaecilia unicolor]